jgi:hypothetical protein
MTSNGRQPLMEDDLQWNMTSNGRLPPMEDDFQWKTTSNGRRPSMKDDLKLLKEEYFKNHLLDHYKMLTFSLDDQTIFQEFLKQDGLLWKKTS